MVLASCAPSQSESHRHSALSERPQRAFALDRYVADEIRLAGCGPRDSSVSVAQRSYINLQHASRQQPLNFVAPGAR
jgi:hypothetical protein